MQSDRYRTELNALRDLRNDVRNVVRELTQLKDVSRWLVDRETAARWPRVVAIVPFHGCNRRGCTPRRYHVASVQAQGNLFRGRCLPYTQIDQAVRGLQTSFVSLWTDKMSTPCSYHLLGLNRSLMGLRSSPCGSTDAEHQRFRWHPEEHEFLRWAGGDHDGRNPVCTNDDCRLRKCVYMHPRTGAVCGLADVVFMNIVFIRGHRPPAWFRTAVSPVC